MQTKGLLERSGFWPQVGTTLILLAAGIEGSATWPVTAAAILVSWGLFLRSARNRSVDARRVDDEIERQVEEANRVLGGEAWLDRTGRR